MLRFRSRLTELLSLCLYDSVLPLKYWKIIDSCMYGTQQIWTPKYSINDTILENRLVHASKANNADRKCYPYSRGR